MSSSEQANGAEAAQTLTQGLTDAAAAERLTRDGLNTLPEPQGPAVWRQLAAQMFHFFAIMLWAAGVLALLAGMPQLGAAIFVIIVVNGVFAFSQEYRAEHAAQHLRSLLPVTAMVVRGGRRMTVGAQELVVDDIVVLEAGDRISADLRVLTAHQLRIDSSLLTGESVPESSGPDATLWAGTFVAEGEATGIVIATGQKTRLADISLLTQTGTRPRTPLALELNRLVRTVAIIAISVGATFLVMSLLIGMQLNDAFIFAIGVTVALVPEGLLPTVTLSLAFGAQRMAERNALVRRLDAVESLGMTTFICTDKTGTLTHNEMSVVEVWTPNGVATIAGEGYEPHARIVAPGDVESELRAVAITAATCSTGHAVCHDGRWAAQGDPMEAAIDVLARRLGVLADVAALTVATTARFPFDARRRRMSIVSGGRLLVKGAPDAVLPVCLDASGAHEAVHDMASRGLRVLAIAQRNVVASDVHSEEARETDLQLLGVLGLEDPPRESAAPALAACRAAGIRVAMITGDHPETARSIAQQVGLLRDGSMVIEGHDLPEDDALLGALLDRDGLVVSRVSPEQKLRIAQSLRARGHVVAMTGDGVNDGPALHAANVGVAMGRSGTDVARAAADVVLLNDDFSSIVTAVEQGRATFANIRRFLTFHLTDNVAEMTPFIVWAMSGGQIPLALGVLQILFLDIATDMLPALALGVEPPAPHELQERPHRRLIDNALLRRVFLVLGPTEAAIEMAAFFTALYAFGWRPGSAITTGDGLLMASGAAFSAVVIGQVGNAFACRSESEAIGTIGWTSNRFLLVAVVLSLLTLAASLLLSPVASLLGQQPPPIWAFFVAALAAPAVLIVDYIHKLVRRRTWKHCAALPLTT